MRALLIACSAAAYERMQRLKEIWKQQEPETEMICKVKCSALPALSEEKSLTDCVGEYFSSVDAIVFICAAGIAVRSIAPWIAHKKEDPAVIVMDEGGAFCISLLSGHWGGANELAQRLARMTGAVPVITTATDREKRFAVDLFARKNGLFLTDWKLAKKISARILEGERIGMYCDFPVRGEAPEEVELIKEPDLRRLKERTGIAVSWKTADKCRFPETLLLVPQVLAAGVGCKKGTSEEKIEAAIESCLKEAGVCREALCAVASIDLKKEEAGLLSFCEKRRLPFLTYSAEALGQVPGNFSDSSFVESVTGVANVCERSALLAAGGFPDPGKRCADRGGKGQKDALAGADTLLISRKKIYDGVTVALAQRKASVKF